MTKVAVTGAAGFIGAYLCRELLRRGHSVVAVDNYLRGRRQRLDNVKGDLRQCSLDIRDEAVLQEQLVGCTAVFHLAAINGTENFYKRPELVLDVGVRGILAVISACAHVGVQDLVVASSAEVYQSPIMIPTDETVPLVIPDSRNPRYSYGASKAISEVIAFNYERDKFRKLQIFRPHNVYGPDMGWKHVIPQLTVRLQALRQSSHERVVPLEIQGAGTETRAFCHVDDIVSGILTMWEKGHHREIYHIGASEEVTIRALAEEIANVLGLKISIVATPAPEGGTLRRCPDITKLMALGYKPKVSLIEGIEQTANWYLQHPAPVDDNILL
jgi:UDP-glucose 4-epimerase